MQYALTLSSNSLWRCQCRVSLYRMIYHADIFNVLPILGTAWARIMPVSHSGLTRASTILGAHGSGKCMYCLCLWSKEGYSIIGHRYSCMEVGYLQVCCISTLLSNKNLTVSFRKDPLLDDQQLLRALYSPHMTLFVLPFVLVAPCFADKP